ncbi:MAG: class I SAM-dependent methyltransferase [Phycisphaerales bacterium]|nr:class I SAM-dependent methyltransferase [Phycisphaerales bacterium]
MSLSSSWQFVGGVGGPLYRIYDALRLRVSRRLSDYLIQQTIAKSRNGSGVRQVRALEAGSGPGSSSSLLAARGDRVYAVCLDIDHGALIEARRRDATLPVVVGDVLHMPFADGVFGLVFNSSTVEHLDEPRKAVVEMRRVCAGTGHVFIGVPYAYGPLVFQPWIRRSRLGVWLGPVFSRGRLDALLQDAGLVPIHHIRYFARFFIGALAAVRGEGLGLSVTRGAGS